MAASLAVVSAAEFGRDMAHDAAIDRARVEGWSRLGTSDFYVVLVANLGNYQSAKVLADSLAIDVAEAPAAAFVGPVTAEDITATGLVIVGENGEAFAADFPAESDGSVLVLAIKDDVAVAFEHTTKAYDGRLEREEYRAYLAEVDTRETEAEPEPAVLPAVNETNYGKDISTFVLNPNGRYDLDPTFSPISGSRVVLEAVARRLVTQRGALSYDPNFGLDLRSWINSAHTESEIFAIGTAIESEAEKDERVSSAVADVQHDRTTSTLTVRLFVDLLTGERFRLVLAIDSVTAEILKVA